MCEGIFIHGRPFSSAKVLFPAYYKKQKTFPPTLNFLVDTGADTTLINSMDAMKLGIVYAESEEGRQIPCFDNVPLEEGKELKGVGGRIKTYVIRDVMLIFKTPLTGEFKDHVEYHTEFLDSICIPEGGAIEIPNLLGRDVINRFKMYYDGTTETLELVRVPIPGSGYGIHIE
ncbi:MAG: hypothetical protein U9O85_08825 [Euryarchaeota archaeon]|nr:hypothetical protein [Euryarchaeota archaeon]